MGAVGFIWRIIHRAFSDTFKPYGGFWGLIAAVILALALGLGSSLYTIGWPVGVAQWSDVSFLGLKIAATLFALFFVINLIRAVEIVRCEDKLKPKMELIDWSVWPDKDQRRQLFKVRVASTGGETVRSVQVSLDSKKPCLKQMPELRLGLPMHLHFSDDRNHERMGEDLNNGDSRWVDVAALDEWGNLSICGMSFGQRNPTLFVNDSGAADAIVIKVTAANSSYIDKVFHLQVKIDNRLHVVEVPPSLEE